MFWVVAELIPTATKMLFPYVTELHWISDAAVLEVHVIPSGLVITRLLTLTPALDTATKRPFP